MRTPSSVALAVLCAAVPLFLADASPGFAAGRTASDKLSTRSGSGPELIYMAGLDGVYLYEQERYALKLVNFIFIPAELTGLALDSYRNTYVVNWTKGLVEEFSPVLSRPMPFRFFTEAQYSTSVTVGPDGTVYVADGGVNEYAPGGGPPILGFNPPYNFSATGLAVDASNNLFVSYLCNCSGAATAFSSQRYMDKDCHLPYNGRIYEYPPHSAKGKCIQSNSVTVGPIGVALDSAGNLLVVNYVSGDRREIAVLSPPHWKVSRRLFTGNEVPQFLTFGSPNHLYYVNGSTLVERAYPQGPPLNSWPIPQPYTQGLAVGDRADFRGLRK